MGSPARGVRSALPEAHAWTALADLFEKLASPAHAARKSTERSRAMLRCLRIVNAVTRLEQQGVEVTGWADLKLPEEETIDPFSGKPLILEKRPDGWVIYSVGKDILGYASEIDDVSGFGLAPIPPLLAK